MTFQAYLDSVKAKTGKSPEDFKKLAAKKGLVKQAEIIAWLKSDYELGLGHARAIAHVILEADEPKTGLDEQISKHFAGGKAGWRKTYDALMEKLGKFGADIHVSPTKSYISLLRKDKKFAIVQVTSERLDIGIKLKGAAAQGRFEEAGPWNSMVTHRVRIDNPKQVDAELIKWLHQAYDKA